MSVKFLAVGLIFFALSGYAQTEDLSRTLFGIHKDVGTSNYSFVKYDLAGPGYDILINFNDTLGDIWELAYNPLNELFYCYGNAAYNENSYLLEVNPCDETVVNLGEINIVNSPVNVAGLCVTDGLTIHPTTGVMYGTINSSCGMSFWAANRVVVFNQNSFGTGVVTCTQIGTMNLSNSEELDLIAITSGNTIFGIDPDVPGNNGIFRTIANVTVNSIGNIGSAGTFTPWFGYRGIAYNQSENLMYSFENQNGLRWLRSFSVPVSGGQVLANNIYQYDLTGVEIRGIVFGSMNCESVSLEDNNFSEATLEILDEIEIVVYPNPTTGSVEISVDQEIEQILVVEPSGKIIHRANNQEIVAQELNLSQLPEGIYVMHVLFENGKTKYMRVVKL